MPAAQLPENEMERLEALHAYHILDTLEENDFDELTELASAICQTPIALISLVDKDRQWFKSHKGIDVTETERQFSFCAHAINRPNELLIVDNPKQDPRFADNPLVTGPLDINFYAGVPLVDQDGFALGSLCVIDNKHKQLNEQQVNALRILAWQVTDKLRLRKQNAELVALNKELVNSKQAVNLLNYELGIINDELELANHELKKSRGSREELYEQLRENESAQRITIEAAGMGTWQIDPETKALKYNSVLADIFGYEDKAPLTYDRAIGQVTDTHRERITKEIERAIADGGIYDITYQQKRFNDEKIIWLRSMGKITPDSDGQHTIFSGVVMDVTGQLEAQQHIKESEERFRTMAEGSHIMIAVGDETSNATYFSKAWADITGRSLDELLEFGWVDLVHPEDKERYVNIYLDAFKEKVEFNGEFRIKDKNGTYRWLLANGQPRFRPDGSFAGYISSCADITEQKEMGQRKDDFISIASHELKTPITALKGAIQLLDRLKDKPESLMLPKMIDQASKSMGKVIALIDDLLNATRMNEGQMPLNKTRFVIAELFEGCCNHVRLDGKYDLVFEGDKELAVFADEHRIDQVIVNFVNNAVKYAANSKEIYLIAEKQGNMAKISVRDTGPGIPEEKQVHLFERYYRAEHKGSQYSGLGLGLYICAEIVKRHGGNIGVDSEVGKGSTFWFTLPLN